MELAPIRTERLVLRPVTLADAEPMSFYRGSDDVTRFLSHASLNREEIDDVVRRAIQDATVSDAAVFRHVWAIETVHSGQVIGDGKTWTTPHPPEPGKLEPGQAALGYVLNPAFHRRGYGREAARALTGWLFTERDIRTVFAGVFEPNLASQALLSSLGFTPDRWFTAEQDGSGKGMPSIRFRLDRDDAGWLG